ncbi:MAG: polysaccharide deacetylase [Firmicutes bacterium]|nr:polysaccharide deacetylase [Bacillota bacterium]
MIGGFIMKKIMIILCFLLFINPIYLYADDSTDTLKETDETKKIDTENNEENDNNKAPEKTNAKDNTLKENNENETEKDIKKDPNKITEDKDELKENESKENEKTKEELLKEKKEHFKKEYEKIKPKSYINPDTIYLTFDDGPSWITEKILDILKKENIKATFFVCGNNTKYGKKILKRMIKEGHKIGNHTYSHDYNKIYKDVGSFFKDLYKNEKNIYEITGIKPKIVRLPGGSNNSSPHKGKDLITKINKKLLQRGYTYIDWNATAADSSPTSPIKEQIIFNVLKWSTKYNNSIVLMHDSAGKKNSLKALPTIIKKLKSFGYSFDVLSEDSFKVTFNTVKLDKKITSYKSNNLLKKQISNLLN